MVTLESPASSIALMLPGSRWAEFGSFSEEFFMPRCGATFDENTVPPWTRGDFRGVLDAATDPPRRCGEGFSSLHPLRRRGFSEERPSEATCIKRQANVLSTFESRAGLVIEVVEFFDNRFDELVEMYNNFEPKRAAQGLPPVGRERIVAWLRHLQKSGHNLLALSNGTVIGHSMLCPMERQRAEFAIFLHQDFRNQGIGTGLTEVTLKFARLKGLRNVWLSVEVNNHCAIRVYRKKGFQVSEIFGPEQEMALDLEEAKGNEVHAHEPAA